MVFGSNKNTINVDKDKWESLENAKLSLNSDFPDLSLHLDNILDILRINRMIIIRQTRMTFTRAFFRQLTELCPHITFHISHYNIDLSTYSWWDHRSLHCLLHYLWPLDNYTNCFLPSWSLSRSTWNNLMRGPQPFFQHKVYPDSWEPTEICIYILAYSLLPQSIEPPFIRLPTVHPESVPEKCISPVGCYNLWQPCFFFCHTLRIHSLAAEINASVISQL